MLVCLLHSLKTQFPHLENKDYGLFLLIAAEIVKVGIREMLLDGLLS